MTNKMSALISRGPRLFLYSLTGVPPAFILQLIIESIVIPHPCYYHAKDTTALFNLFYVIDSSEGYHPYPSFINNLLTLLGGAIAGVAVCSAIRRRHG